MLSFYGSTDNADEASCREIMEEDPSILQVRILSDSKDK